MSEGRHGDNDGVALPLRKKLLGRLSWFKNAAGSLSYIYIIIKKLPVDFRGTDANVFFLKQTNKQTNKQTRFQRSDITANAGLTTSCYVRDCLPALQQLAVRLGVLESTNEDAATPDEEMASLLQATVSALNGAESAMQNIITTATFLAAAACTGKTDSAKKVCLEVFVNPCLSIYWLCVTVSQLVELVCSCFAVNFAVRLCKPACASLPTTTNVEEHRVNVPLDPAVTLGTLLFPSEPAAGAPFFWQGVRRVLGDQADLFSAKNTAARANADTAFLVSGVRVCVLVWLNQKK